MGVIIFVGMGFIFVNTKYGWSVVFLQICVFVTKYGWFFFTFFLCSSLDMGQFLCQDKKTWNMSVMGEFLCQEKKTWVIWVKFTDAYILFTCGGRLSKQL